MEVEVILLVKNVDVVYDKDLKVYVDVKKFIELSYMEVI